MTQILIARGRSPTLDDDMTAPPDAAASTSSAPSPRRGWWVALLVAMALAFAINALLAVRTKSPTYDEPIHTLSSWLIVNEGDFRMNPEHPALWKYVAGLGLIGQPLNIDLHSPTANGIFVQLERQWWFAADTLSRQPGDVQPAERLVGRARVAMSLFSIALALIVARWAWVWGGPLAAVMATALLMFDPNFLAHGALVTNDVASAVCIALASYLTWRLGVRFTWRNAILLGLTCVAGVGIKFTCLLLAPMLGIPLFYRALEGSPWAFGAAAKPVARKVPRLLAVVGFGVATLLVAWASLWPMYLFRYAPTPVGDRFANEYVRKLLAYNAVQYREDMKPDNVPHHAGAELLDEVKRYEPTAGQKAMFWISEHHLVPQAWGFGLNYANARSFNRSSYLMGEFSEHGFLTFFPCAVLFKTPTATLLIGLGSLIGGASLARRRFADAGARWKLVCLLVPPAVYFAAAMSSPLNIGLRHVLPVYPPLFVAAGVLMARWVRTVRLARFVAPVAIAAVAIESLAVAPNYLSFFNVPSGGSKGGLALLSDSNLDWGQDLNAFAVWAREWHAANPKLPLYFSYFGSIDPHAYGIDYINAIPGYAMDRTPPTNELNGGVYAVSASMLQGLYPPELRPAMQRLRQRQPLAVINDTIYIYDLGPPKPTTATAPVTPMLP